MNIKLDDVSLWQHIHGGSTHFPIVLVIVAFVTDALVAFRKVDRVRDVGLWCLVAATLFAIPATISGLSGQYGWFGVTEKWDAKHLDIHRITALTLTGSIVVLTLWRIVRRNRLKNGELMAFVGMLLLVSGLTMVVGYLGGLVSGGY